jgi:ABC-type nitrate/sulfonate/bicarbonate transport system substrate-binding protein
MKKLNPRLRWLTASTALVVAVALTATACSSSKKDDASAATGSSSSGASAAVTTVNVGITSVTGPPTFLPLVANKLGLDKQNGLAIKFITIAPAVTAQALTKGSVDVLAAPAVETAILQGASFKIFAGAAQSYWHFVASNSISDWSGLKGKKIALPCGQAATCHSFMDDLLTAHGVKPSDVTYIYGTAQATYESLAAGSVNAALTTPPYTYALTTAGKTKEFDITSAPRYLGTQYTATAAYIKKNPAVIAAFAKMLVAAEAAITKLPIQANVLSIINDFEKANGIDPATLDQNRFLTEFATTKSWQLVPTRALITQDLALLKAIPDLASAAGKASFDDLVYMVPEFAGQYG